MRPATLALAAAFVLAAATAAPARPLQLIQASGTIGMCAHPNLLPFSSKTADPPGFEIELGKALAQQLGVSLQPEWVVTPYQVPRADCDILLDVIADTEAQSGTGLKFSRPYFGSGVGLAVPADSPITSFAALDGHTKVAVQTGSMAGMLLGKRGIPISIFGPEEDMLEAVASGEVSAAAVTPMSAGYFNVTHPDHKLRFVPPDPAEQRLQWNIAVGMRKSDPALRAAMDEAVAKLLADGTVARIYARYGIAPEAPR